MYRVFIEDKLGFVTEDCGIFDTQEDAISYKRIHAIDLEQGDTMRIVEGYPEFVKTSGIEFVSFSAYVKDKDNEKDNFYVKDLSKWNWSLNGIAKDYIGYPNRGIVQYDGGETKASVEIYIPWPAEDLAKERTPSAIATLKAKLAEVAQKALEIYVKKAKDEEYCEFFENTYKLEIEDFWSFKKKYFPEIAKEEIKGKLEKLSLSPVWEIEKILKGREKAENDFEKAQVENAIEEVLYELNVFKEIDPCEAKEKLTEAYENSLKTLQSFL